MSKTSSVARMDDRPIITAKRTKRGLDDASKADAEIEAMKAKAEAEAKAKALASSRPLHPPPLIPDTAFAAGGSVDHKHSYPTPQTRANPLAGQTVMAQAPTPPVVIAAASTAAAANPMAGFKVEPLAFTSVKPEFTEFRRPTTEKKPVITKVKKEKPKSTPQSVTDLTQFDRAQLGQLSDGLAKVVLSRIEEMKAHGPAIRSGAMIFSSKPPLADLIRQKLNLAVLFSSHAASVLMEPIQTIGIPFTVSNLKEIRDVTVDGQQRKYLNDTRFDDNFLASDDNLTGPVSCVIYKAASNIEQASGGQILPFDVIGISLKFFSAMFPANWSGIFRAFEQQSAQCYVWNARTTPNGPLDAFVSVELVLLGALGVYDWTLVTGSVTTSYINKTKVDPRSVLLRMGLTLIHAFKIAQYTVIREFIQARFASFTTEIAQLRAALAAAQSKK